MNPVAFATSLVDVVLMAVAPGIGQRTARRNAFAAAAAASRSRRERAEAFAALSRMSTDQTQPAAS